MAIAPRTVHDTCLAAREASLTLATAPSAAKDAVLESIAQGLLDRAADILEANAADLADDRALDLGDALRDRLTLTPERVEAMAAGVREIAALPDPVGEEIDHRRLASGL